MKNAIAITALLLAAAFLMGCADQSAEQQQQTQQAIDSALEQQQAAQQNAQQQEQTQNDAGQNADQQAQQNAAQDNIIARYLAAAQSHPYKAEYQSTSTAQGYSGNTNMTMYYKYPNTRTDTSTSAQGMMIQSRSFMNLAAVSDGIVSCTNYSNSWSCQNIKAGTGQQQKSATDVASDSANYTLTADGSITKAGLSGDCFKFTFKNDSSITGRTCYTTDGVLLFYSVSASGYQIEMSLTSFGGTVSDSDFTPPAEVKEGGSMMPGAGTGAGASGTSETGTGNEYCDQIPDAYKAAAGC